MNNKTISFNNGFRTLGNLASDVVERYLPNAFIFAILLTFFTMALALAFTPKGPAEIGTHWGEGFWFVLSFSMQAALALITGWAFADSPPINRVLGRIADIPDTHRQAVFAAAAVGVVFALFHWGVVLIASALFARELGIAMEKKGIDVHYPLLVAAGYGGYITWHQGLSGAAPLLIATPDHFLVDTIGSVPISQTIFNPANLIILAALIVVVLVVMPLMAPRKSENITTIPQEKLRQADATKAMADGGTAAVASPDSRLKASLLDSRILCMGTGLLILSYLGYLFATNPFLDVFNLNIFISLMFGLGFIFHMRLRSYIEVFADAIKGASQILIQFQFYGGIMGIMVWSGLATQIAVLAANLANGTTWYLFAFLSSGIINFFVPSGGGQWTVIGDILVTSANQIPGASVDRTMIAFMMGDQWSNMVQPFWVLPMLGIVGLSIRDMMGYTAVLFVFSGIVLGAGSLLMGMGVI
ncbi:short-chain fatty acid transporter [Halobacteriales archaeon QS_6_64_34]|nr:MAG: short-chain fatty acid transporter [Halobacteriales archaeon QS_6_64_34]